MPAIREEQVLHVAKLARLRLSPEEVSLYQDQLGRILELVEELSGLDLSSVPETSSTLGGATPLRKDEARRFPGAAVLLENAPASEDGCFKVPRVLE